MPLVVETIQASRQIPLSSSWTACITVCATLRSVVSCGQAFYNNLVQQFSILLQSYNAKKLLCYLSLSPVIEADSLFHSLTSPSTSACGGGCHSDDSVSPVLLIQQIWPIVLMCGNILLVFQLSLLLMIVLILLSCLTVLISAMKFLVFIQVQSPLPMLFTSLFLPFSKLSAAIPSLISMQFPLSLWMESHCCPLLCCLHLLPVEMPVRLWSLLTT